MVEAGSISSRLVVPDDEPFLFEVYASTRATELALTPWNDEQRLAFVQMQFAAQRTHYQRYYPQAVHEIILRGGGPIGRSYIDRRETEIRILDLTLLPEVRGVGIGAYLLRELMREADATGRSLSIYVERFNPSLSLFERLGFAKKEEDDIYFLMERQPVSASS
jgi:ribosomal protein S18 acetylase RimI-like enzyme